MGNQSVDPDFEIVPPLIKLDSRPAQWILTMKTHPDQKKHQVTVETMVLTKFGAFMDAVYEQTNRLLMDISQTRWKAMLRGLPVEIRETPGGAKPERAIETALDGFLDEAKEKPDLGMLKAFPGHDEEVTFFKYQAFDNYLQNLGYRLERRMVFDGLKNLGFSQGAYRMGNSVAKVWMKKRKKRQESP